MMGVRSITLMVVLKQLMVKINALVDVLLFTLPLVQVVTFMNAMGKVEEVIVKKKGEVVQL
jgi:translation elongation factor EF-G